MSDKPNGPTVAVVHAHFGINSKQGEPATGAFTREEQVTALNRFVKWHERQAAVGRDMLRRLEKATSAVEPTAAPIAETQPV